MLILIALTVSKSLNRSRIFSPYLKEQWLFHVASLWAGSGVGGGGEAAGCYTAELVDFAKIPDDTKVFATDRKVSSC